MSRPTGESSEIYHFLIGGWLLVVPDFELIRQFGVSVRSSCFSTPWTVTLTRGC